MRSRTEENERRGNEPDGKCAGENVRDWIYVTDHCEAIREVLAKGRIGESYLIGSRNEQKNLDVVHTICDTLDELHAIANPMATKNGARVAMATSLEGNTRVSTTPS